MSFNKVLSYLSYCKDMGKTLLHLRRSETVICKCFTKKGVLENFAKFTGKDLCSSHCLIKLQAKCFPMIFAKFSRTPCNKTPYAIKII